MEKRNPFQDLTADNIAGLCENVKKLYKEKNQKRPRTSLMRAFDPLYESPCKIPESSNISLHKCTYQNIGNDENCDPLLINIENEAVGAACDVTTFIEDIINEALDITFYITNLNNTLHEDEMMDVDVPELEALPSSNGRHEHTSNAPVADLQTIFEQYKIEDLNLSLNSPKKYPELQPMCVQNDEDVKPVNSDNTFKETELKFFDTSLQNKNPELEPNCLHKDKDVEVVNSNSFNETALESLPPNSPQKQPELQPRCLEHDLDVEHDNDFQETKPEPSGEIDCNGYQQDDSIVIINNSFKETGLPINISDVQNDAELHAMCQPKHEVETVLRNNRELITKCETLEKLVEELKSENAAKEKEFDVNASKCQNLQECIEKLKSELETLKSEHASKEKQLESKLVDLSEDNRDTQEQNEDIEKMKNEFAVKKKEFESQMASFDQLVQSQITEIKTLKHENSLATRHLANIEIAFADVHQKYERSKVIIEGYKLNEDKLQDTLHMFKENLRKYDEKLELIKQKGTEHINRLSRDAYVTREECQTELGKMISKIKHLEIKNSALTNALEQKTKECTDLTSLCEEVTRGYK